MWNRIQPAQAVECCIPGRDAARWQSLLRLVAFTLSASEKENINNRVKLHFGSVPSAAAFFQFCVKRPPILVASHRNSVVISTSFMKVEIGSICIVPCIDGLSVV